MSLNLQDLGLIDTVREIVGELNSGRLIIVSNRADNTNNPYTREPLNPQIKGVYPIISFKDDTIRSRLQFGEVESGLYHCTIALPPEPINISDYCFIDWSEETRIVPGVINRVEYRLSSLVYVGIDSKESVPFSWQQTKALLPI